MGVCNQCILQCIKRTKVVKARHLNIFVRKEKRLENEGMYLLDLLLLAKAFEIRFMRGIKAVKLNLFPFPMSATTLLVAVMTVSQGNIVCEIHVTKL